MYSRNGYLKEVTDRRRGENVLGGRPTWKERATSTPCLGGGKGDEYQMDVELGEAEDVGELV